MVMNCPPGGALFDPLAVRRYLDNQEWDVDGNEEREERRLYIGTVSACYPSGKFYMPWACSNVEACASCKGQGSTLRVKRRTAKKRIKRGYPVPSGRVPCTACGGLGSREAHLDERWRAYAESFADALGKVSFEHGDGDPCDLFFVEYRDVEEEEEEEEEKSA